MTGLTGLRTVPVRHPRLPYCHTGGKEIPMQDMSNIVELVAELVD